MGLVFNSLFVTHPQKTHKQADLGDTAGQFQRQQHPDGIVMPDVRIPEREERRPPRQCNLQKGKFIADSSQGSCRIQRSGAGSESLEPKLLPKFIG